VLVLRRNSSTRGVAVLAACRPDRHEALRRSADDGWAFETVRSERLHGLPIGTSAAMPGHRHELTCTRELSVTAALNCAAAELNLPALADAGYDGASHDLKTPVQATGRTANHPRRQPPAT
jgi:hypothetical protein